MMLDRKGENMLLDAAAEALREGDAYTLRKHVLTLAVCLDPLGPSPMVVDTVVLNVMSRIGAIEGAMSDHHGDPPDSCDERQLNLFAP